MQPSEFSEIVHDHITYCISSLNCFCCSGKFIDEGQCVLIDFSVLIYLFWI